MSSQSPWNIRFEVHFHSPIREMHLHLPQSPDARVGRGSYEAPCSPTSRVYDYGNWELETPDWWANVVPPHPGLSTGFICVKGQVTDEDGNGPDRVLARIYTSEPVDPDCGSMGSLCVGETSISGAQFYFEAVDGAQHSEYGVFNWLFLRAIWGTGSNAAYADKMHKFIGFTSNATNCSGTFEQMASAGGCGEFSHPMLGRASRQYTVKAKRAEKGNWRLLSEYGAFELPEKWRVEYNCDSPHGAPRWVSAGDAAKAPRWRLVVRRTKRDLVGRLYLVSVGGVRFEKPLAWKAECWNPVGRNRLKPQFEGQAPEIVIEPAKRT